MNQYQYHILKRNGLVKHTQCSGPYLQPLPTWIHSSCLTSQNSSSSLCYKRVMARKASPLLTLIHRATFIVPQNAENVLPIPAATDTCQPWLSWAVTVMEPSYCSPAILPSTSQLKAHFVKGSTAHVGVTYSIHPVLFLIISLLTLLCTLNH